MATSLRHAKFIKLTAINYHQFIWQCPMKGIYRRISMQSRHSFIKSRNPLLASYGFAPLRWNSSTKNETTSVAESVSDSLMPTDYIPPIPELPGNLDSISSPDVLNALGEPTLSSLGLASWTPSGLIQSTLEILHVSGLPWWGSIVAGTVVLRLVMFPLVILSQRNVVKMSNCMPKMTLLQQRFTEARHSGNYFRAAKAGQELMDYMKNNNIKMMNNMLIPFAQVPVFLSVFFAIRSMASLPVESMKEGGMLWFTDLTLTDPFYGLPLLTAGTLLLTIEMGVDGVKSRQLGHTMKWVMRGLPVLMFPFLLKFPAAMLCYWFTSNVFSFTQVMLLKLPMLRDFFKIGKLVDHPLSSIKKKGFFEGFQESYNNAKIASQMENRKHADVSRLREAGQGPIQKTYPINPTKLVDIDSTRTNVSAKTKS